MGVHSTDGEVLKDNPDRFLVAQARCVEGHGDIKAVYDDVVEGAMLAAIGRRPLVQGGGGEVGNQVGNGKCGVPGRNLVREDAEVESAGAVIRP